MKRHKPPAQPIEPKIQRKNMTACTQIDLLRHGETQLGKVFRGRLDDELTPSGWAQMHASVGSVWPTNTSTSAAPWQRVISSPLRRCRLFAEQFAQQIRRPLQLDARLVELDFGVWEGLTATEIMRDYPGQLEQFWANPWAFTPAQGEPLPEFEQRLRAAWRDISRTHAGQRVLVVTHGGVMRLLHCLAQQLDTQQLLTIEVPHAALQHIGAYPEAPAAS